MTTRWRVSIIREHIFSLEQKNTQNSGSDQRDDEDQWKSRAEKAERLVAAVRGVLIQHADGAFLAGDQSAEELARHIVAKLDSPEPDLETVPLQALLEAIGSFLEHDQALAIHGSYDPTTHVDIHALGRVFCVETGDASEMLTHAHDLAQREVVKIGK